jgi:hypothetical protein
MGTRRLKKLLGAALMIPAFVIISWGVATVTHDKNPVGFAGMAVGAALTFLATTLLISE